MEDQPDNLEKVTRLGCGALLGLFIGIFVGIRLFFRHGNNNTTAFVITLILTTLFSAIFSLYQGDRFWDNILDWLKKRK